MKKLIPYIILFTSFGSFAQNSNRELTFGGIIHTRSGFIGGINAKYAKKINKKWSSLYAVELVNIRHPKELRIPTQYSGTFVLGKSNYLFSLRPQMGMEKIIFTKDPNEGVKVSIIGAAGPSLAILKPYMVEYQNPDQSSTKEQYNEDIDLSTIIGNAGWYRGFGQSKFLPGAHAKLSLAFEYSTFKNRISAVETGFLFEQLTSKVELNPFVSSESSFFIAFVSISFGKKL